MSGRSQFLLVTLLVACVAFLVPRASDAHPTAMSGMRVRIHGQNVSVALDLDGRTLVDLHSSRLDSNQDDSVTFKEIQSQSAFIESYVLSGLSVSNGATACKNAGSVTLSGSRESRLYAEVEYVCDAPWTTVSLRNVLFMEDPGGHRHYAEIHVHGRPRHHVFAPGQTVLVLDASGVDPNNDRENGPNLATTQEHPVPSLASLGREGVFHVLLGLDHVLFLVAVLLAVRSYRELLLVVTSFTVAHSITLALATFDLVTVAPRFVESLIALSIVYVAAENILRRLPQERYALTFTFGLAHGFGFAASLKDLVGTTGGGAAPLFAFNAGVEIGQLAVVLPLFPAVAWLSRQELRERVVRSVLSAGVGAIGALWFVQRAFFADF